MKKYCKPLLEFNSYNGKNILGASGDKCDFIGKDPEWNFGG